MNEEFEELLVDLAEHRQTRLFGKYRGMVTQVDENDLGYISATAHEVFGEDFVLPRVSPAVPFAGKGHGLVALPEVDDGVWIEFEAGDVSKPIWTGFWWADDEMPEPKGPLIRSFITTAGHKLILDDANKEVKLQHAEGAEMTMTGDDITIKIGQASVKMSDGEISLKVGSTAEIKITANEISLKSGGAGVISITTGGVNIGNGAVKTM